MLIVQINLYLYLPFFTETLMVRKTFTKGQFAADKDGSYKCNDKSELDIQGVNFRTYNLQYAAFQKNITEFKSSGRFNLNTNYL